MDAVGSDGRSSEFGGGFFDSLVNVLWAGLEFLGDLLLGLQSSLLQRSLDGAFPDDEQSCLPVVDNVPELLDVRARHPSPEVATDSADSATDDSGTEDRGWEKDANHSADGSTAPPSVPGRHFVLVDVDLTVEVLRDHGGVVGPDCPR